MNTPGIGSLSRARRGLSAGDMALALGIAPCSAYAQQPKIVAGVGVVDFGVATFFGLASKNKMSQSGDYCFNNGDCWDQRGVDLGKGGGPRANGSGHHRWRWGSRTYWLGCAAADNAFVSRYPKMQPRRRHL